MKQANACSPTLLLIISCSISSAGCFCPADLGAFRRLFCSCVFWRRFYGASLKGLMSIAQCWAKQEPKSHRHCRPRGSQNHRMVGVGRDLCWE